MSKGEQAPSVGRVVHFVYGNQHIPAIITDPGFTGEIRESDGSPGLLPPIPQADRVPCRQSTLYDGGNI
jgi:hypothetical protein